MIVLTNLCTNTHWLRDAVVSDVRTVMRLVVSWTQYWLHHWSHWGCVSVPAGTGSSTTSSPPSSSSTSSGHSSLAAGGDAAQRGAATVLDLTQIIDSSIANIIRSITVSFCSKIQDLWGSDIWVAWGTYHQISWDHGVTGLRNLHSIRSHVGVATKLQRSGFKSKILYKDSPSLLAD